MLTQEHPHTPIHTKHWFFHPLSVTSVSQLAHYKQHRWVMLPGWGCAGWSLIHRQTLNDALRYPGEAVVGYNPKTYKHTHTNLWSFSSCSMSKTNEELSVFPSNAMTNCWGGGGGEGQREKDVRSLGNRVGPKRRPQVFSVLFIAKDMVHHYFITIHSFIHDSAIDYTPMLIIQVGLERLCMIHSSK